MSNAATQRVIALVDMDCFYCQVEARLNPTLKGKPVAVVQYNQWKGGGIIAVNYEARDRGVTRYMRGDEAKEKCPEIILVPVPTIRGKADLSNYREAGDEVAKIFSEYSDCVQRASIDEAYLDLTKAVENRCKKNEFLHVDLLPNTFVVGYCDLETKSEDEREIGLMEWMNLVRFDLEKDAPEYQLAIGAIIVEEMRSEIFKRTGFHCSAGIAHNKILAKLTAGLHKPNKQTVLPQESVPELYETLPLHKVRNLGGKFGKQVADKLSIYYMSELYKFSLAELQKKFDEKTSLWLHNIARGIDLEPVVPRLRPESIGCCKNFTGKNALTTKSEVEHWLKELATEISERLYKDLEKNKRRAKLLTVSFSQETPMTRCGALNSYEIGKIVAEALDLLKKFNSASQNEDAWTPPIKYLGLAASKFTEEISSIEKYFINNKNVDQAKKSGVSTIFIKRPNTVSTSSSASVSVSASASVTTTAPGTASSPNSGSGFSSTSTSSNSSNFGFESESKSKSKSKSTSKSRSTPKPKSKSTSSSASSKTLDDIIGEEKIKKLSHDRLNNDTEVETSEDSTKPSFFLEFLNTNNESDSNKEGTDEFEKHENEEEEGETWISLSEVFPDINQAEVEVVKNLPEPLQKKFRERIKSTTGDQEIEESSTSEEILLSDLPTTSLRVKETCQKCGKSIPVSEISVHSDYHAALELYSEINKPTKTSELGSGNKGKSKESEGLNKRKKKGAAASPSKKMKSLTSFFVPLSKK